MILYALLGRRKMVLTILCMISFVTCIEILALARIGITLEHMACWHFLTSLVNLLLLVCLVLMVRL